MIRRINKLKNVGRFAELRSQGGNQHEFTKVNVIYAPNACGKTTLCDVFRSLGTGKLDFILGRKRFSSTTAIEIEILLHGSPTPKAVFAPAGWRLEPAGSNAQKTLVYDDRFVADNVLVGHSIAVEQRRNLYGLALGAQGRLLKEAVDTAERELGTATTALNTARAALTPLVPAGFTIDTFRPLVKDDGIDQLIQAATTELEAARRTKQNADSIRQRKAMSVGTPPVIPDGVTAVLEATLDDAAFEAEAKIRQHLETHSSGLSLNWVGQGHRAQIGTSCPHCGQEMGELEILSAYRVFFSGALQEQQAAQARISREAEDRFGSVAQQRIEQLLNTHLAEWDWWRDAGGFSFELPFRPETQTVQNAMEAVRSALSAAIQRKQSQPALQVVLSEVETAALAAWDEVAATLTGYMAAIDPISVAIAERQRTAGSVDTGPIERRIASLNAQKKRHEPAVVAAIAAFDGATTAKADKERAKAAANNALREQSEQILTDYGGRINALLARFQVGFRLESGGVNFRGGPPAGELAVEILGTRVSTTPDDARNPAMPSLANTLSGGDRSALGLAFFVAVAERDPDISNTILVFDDPFHSQDRSRRRRTIECVHRLAAASRQCFVLSHELDFAREVARMAGVQVNTFTLDPLADHSLLEAKSLPPLPGRAYEQDYAKLTAFLRNPSEFADQLKDVARCIRQSLEGYMRTKFPESWGDKDWIGNMIEKIRDSKPGDVLHHAKHLEADLTEVNNWGKRYYHGETDGSDAGSVDVNELKGYVAQTIEIISK
jgi:wobble nucleotide-excising tRNase